MTRPARILVWTFTSLLTLLAILVVVIATFDWNRVKPLLNEKVSEALQRPFAINGNLAVDWRTEPEEGGWRAWVPWPHFIAEDLTLGNPECSRNRRWSAWSAWRSAWRRCRCCSSRSASRAST
ncbi:hypothetical protein O164_21490 [Pseudomonas taiwanensis SJ9]|uniref:AsmA domain-containing protein n=1 Tax=Pseudomonas taiwanensis SJ9 TaxID=1388762 RepID=V7D9B2_9PSED|nr:hypothetical protein O164_21490 [Pseudomonas taiwanensis SJ9]